MTSYRIRLSVNGADPPVTRVVGLPKGSNLGDLDRTIQAVLGWGDHRPHLFDIPSKGVTAQPGAAVEEENILHEEDVSLWTHRVPMTFVYGFEPRWEVDVSFLKQSKDELEHPVLLESEGDAPLEDCAGIEAWNDILRILVDPDHPDHGDVKAWADEVRGLEESDPEKAGERLSGLERPSKDDEGSYPTVRDPRTSTDWRHRTEADPRTLKFLPETEKSDARRISRMRVPCPECGEPCTPVMDKDGPPVSISGRAHYPIRIDCPCGTSTGLSLLNDGYVVGYNYTARAHPYPMYARYDDIRRRLRAERNPLRRGRLLIDLARESDLLDERRGILDKLDEAIRLGGNRDLGVSSTARIDWMRLARRPVLGGVLFSALDPVSFTECRLAPPAKDVAAAKEDHEDAERTLSSSEVPEWIRRRLLLKAIGRIDAAGDHATAARMRTEAIRSMIAESQGTGEDSELYRRIAATVSDLCADCSRSRTIDSAGEALNLYYTAFDSKTKHPSPFLQIDSRVRMGLYRMTVRNDRKGAQKDLEAGLELAKKHPGTFALERSAVAAALLSALGRNPGENMRWTMDITTQMIAMQMVDMKDGLEMFSLLNATGDESEEDLFTNPFMRMMHGPLDDEDDPSEGIRGPSDAWCIGFMTHT